MASNTQAVAVTEKTIGDQLARWADNLGNYAVRDYDRTAWLKTAMLCILESDKLRELMATQAGQHSLYHALRYAATTGLSLNPQEGKACLVPRDGKIVYWIMSRGWVELLTAHPSVDRVQGFVVYLNDVFDLENTIDGDRYTHRPALDDRGDVRGFASAIRTKDGRTSVHYMTLAQMQAHRDQYNTFKSDKSAWATSFEGRGIAACVKMHVRRLALGTTPAIAAAADADDADGELPKWRDVTPGASAADVEAALKGKKPEPAAGPAKPEAKPESVGTGGAAADGGKSTTKEEGLF